MGKIADYLKNYNNSGTAQGYYSAVYHFIDFIYGKQRKLYRVGDGEREKYEKLVDKYLESKRNYPEDMANFVVSMHDRPPLTARHTFIRVKEFFNYYNRELSSKDLKFIRNKLPKGNARTMERDMDIETIRTILQHLDVKGRALVLVLASSGMRINEALSVTLDDVALNVTPSCISVRGEKTKTGDARITFISSEATQAVNEWLKVRGDYLRSSAKRNNGLVKSGRGGKKSGDDDGRLFPFSDQNASAIWDTALGNAGLLSRDKTTNRKQLHYHQFRKFFISQLSLIVSKEIAEMLAGHSGYLTGAYRRYTKKQLAEEYLKGQHLLTIQTPKELQEIESEFKAKMQNHSEIIEDLVKEKIALKQQMAANHDEMKREIEDMRFVFNNMYLIADAVEGALKTGSDEDKKKIIAALQKVSREHPVKDSHGPNVMIEIPKEYDWRTPAE
ncbi:MAG: site-specific integrase [Methanoregula sp.]|jgi:integrase|uniref:tyrosine-type recombinase/integrase n=1 Tax=Methanoregula sp. TaxID=2052170 RepID=UPI003C180F66